MRKQFLSKRAMKNIRTNILNIACVSMIALLLCACASENKKQMSPLANDTSQDSEKNVAENGEANDDQEIVCRKIAVSGSRIGKKTCATKKQWALRSKKTAKNAEGYIRDVNEASRKDVSYPIPIQLPPDGMEVLFPPP